MSTLIVEGPVYFSDGDEAAFFAWLEAIPAVRGVSGKVRDLHIALRPGDLNHADWRELNALFRRYEMDMEGLSRISPQN